MRLAAVACDPPDIELHDPVGICVADADQTPCRAESHAELLVELPRERLPGALAGMGLAAGKLPGAGHMLPCGALGDQDTPAGIDERPGNHGHYRLRHRDASPVVRGSA